MTPQELQALVELLNRCPMTAAERMWCQTLIERLAKPQTPVDVPVVAGEDTEEASAGED